MTKPRSFPAWKQWEQFPHLLNDKEKKQFLASFLCFLLSGLGLIGLFLFSHRVEVPAVGGDVTEALVGSPRLINPLFAPLNDVDMDLSALVYSGLLTWSPKDGYQNDLADQMTVSDDRLQYTFRIKPNAKFSDGTSLQARDVLFTYNAVLNPDYRSPLLSVFRGVRIEQVDDRTVSFSLSSPNNTFAHTLTLGILPEHLWSDILPQNAMRANLNLQPVGSGPYQFKEFAKDKKGVIRSYTLKRNTHFYGSSPHIDRLTFKFYPDEPASTQALQNKNVEASGYIAFEHRDLFQTNRTINIFTPSIPRATALYFNTQNTFLKNPVVRLAIAESIDTSKLVNDVLNHHATILNGPLFPDSTGYDPAFAGIGFHPDLAAASLDAAGFQKPAGATWRKQAPAPVTKKTKRTSTNENAPKTETPDMRFHLLTQNTQEFTRVAEEIKKELALLGIDISVQVLEADELKAAMETQSYDLLLSAAYGATDPDPYYFWHSSQIGKTKLNIAHYKNDEVDALLQKMRDAKTSAEQETFARQFQSLLVKEVPAVFLYQSEYAFAEPKKIHLDAPSHLRIPSDRFANVEDWYIKTKQTLK